MSSPTEGGWRLEPLDFNDLAGWAEDDHEAAFMAFRLSAERAARHPPKIRAIGIDGEAVAAAAAAALAVDGRPGRSGARDFFEALFFPRLIRPAAGDGYFTGYYEPEAEGSPVRTPRFGVPLYARPDDLIDIDDSNRPAGMASDIRFARRVGDRIEAYPDRAEIEGGRLDGRGLELVWLEDPVDAFFIHVQGSARIRLPGGETMRVGFAGKSGHAYTPIGRVLIEMGALARGTVTMASIRAWLAAHPDQAAGVMQRNRSFIFFRRIEAADPDLGPMGAAGIQLTPSRSLAVDRELHTFHSPVWVETRVPEADGFAPFRRLMIAQDTGSAIVGPARGDIFFGSGASAAAIAGPMQSSGRMVLLVPREAAR